MKQTRLWLTTIAVLLCILTANAHDFEVDGIYYGISSSTDLTVTVTCRGNNYYSYSDEYSGAVTIPSTVTYNGKTYSVTSIGYGAFFDCRSLTAIIVEEANSIYDSRNDCNAIIETSSNALITGCSTTVIPESVTSIGDYAFRDCSGLTSITIPESVTSIGNYAFYNCI